MILQAIFDHGVLYNYQANTQKLADATVPITLKNLCVTMPAVCPHEYFFSGPRSSVLRFDVGISPVHVKGHEMSKLAGLALEEFGKSGFSNHEKVQNFLMLYDKKTLAVELPLWIEKDENLPLVSGNLTGHADIIRLEGDAVWIWDYKPHAAKEKYAKTQIFYYALMLSLRTGIPLERIRCGYFDSEDAYMFSPGDVRVNKEIPAFIPK